MAVDVEATVKVAAEQIRKLIEDAASMTVETWYIESGVDEVPVVDGKAEFRKNAHPLAQTEVQFDGDSVAVLPVLKAADGTFEVDQVVRNLHDHNVRTATEYRAGILNAVVGILREMT